jgi:hypothetical protein
MFDELEIWWQNTSTETRTVLQDGGLMVGALLGGHFLGEMVARGLRKRNFDAALRLPGSSRVNAEADRGFAPSVVGGLLVRLTIWGAAAWWLAAKHGRVEVAASLGLIINRAWALATVLVAALSLGSLLAQRLIDCLEGLPKTNAEGARNGTAGAAGARWNPAGAIGAVVYILVALIVLLVAADVFDWPLTRTSALALWKVAQNLLIAAAALFIGCLGARWARDMVTPEAASSPEKRAGQYTALGIVAATTVLAVAVLLSSAGVLIGVAALALVGLLLWLVRGYLPDVTAGLQLRTHQVREVWLDGVSWQLSEIGLLSTQVTRAGEFWRLQNRLVLQARLHGAPAEAAAP